MHPRVTVNPMCGFALPFDDELAMLDRLGARRAGLAARKLATYGWERGIRAVRAAGLDVPYLVHGVYTPPGDAAGWQAERDGLLRAVEAAAALGAPLVYLNSGPPGAVLWEEAVEAFTERIAPVVEAARRAGVGLALENTASLRTDIGFLSTLRETAWLAERLDVGVCADLYCCWLERGLRETLRAQVGRLLLVQVSDFVFGTLDQPNRAVPGDGDLPLRRLVAEVCAAGYTGPFDLELLGPRIDAEGAESAVRRGVAWLTSVLDTSPG